MANIEAVREITSPLHHMPLYLDACRFAENAWFMQAARARIMHRLVAQTESRRRCFLSPTAAPSRPRKMPSQTSADFCAPTTIKLAEQETESVDPHRRISHLRRSRRARSRSHRRGPFDEVLQPEYLEYRIASTRLSRTPHCRQWCADCRTARRPCHLHRCRSHAAAHSASQFPRPGAGGGTYTATRACGRSKSAR
jgi:hypothetical protein